MYNPNGASSIYVDLEINRPPTNLEARVFSTWPDMDK
jgi:hypothetical protein